MASRIKSLIFGGIFAAIGGTLFYLISYPVITQSIESKSWPTTTATVTESRVNDRAGSDDDLYAIQFRTEFSVNGKSFTTNGRYLASEGAASWKGDKYDFVNAHPVGSTIEMYYNPEKPHEATTSPGFQTNYFFMIGFSCLFFFVGIFVIFKGLRGA